MKRLIFLMIILLLPMFFYGCGKSGGDGDAKAPNVVCDDDERRVENRCVVKRDRRVERDSYGTDDVFIMKIGKEFQNELSNHYNNWGYVDDIEYAKISSDNAAEKFLKEAMQVCDTQWGFFIGTHDYDSCEYWRKGLIEVIMDFYYANQGYVDVEFRAAPKTNSYNYNGWDAFWNFYLYLGPNNSGVRLNPMQLRMKLDPINSDQGFILSERGHLNTQAYNDFVKLRVMNGDYSDDEFLVEFIYNKKTVSTGNAYRWY